MSIETYTWLKTAHLIGVFLWLGGLFSVYWLLRVHAHAPKDVLDKLTLMERSLALSMDLAAGVAIGCGVVMAVVHGGDHPTSSLFGAPGAGWFHIKLAIVVLGDVFGGNRVSSPPRCVHLHRSPGWETFAEAVSNSRTGSESSRSLTTSAVCGRVETFARENRW